MIILKYKTTFISIFYVKLIKAEVNLVRGDEISYLADPHHPVVSAQYFPTHEKYSLLTKFKHEDMKKIFSRFSNRKVPKKEEKPYTYL